MPRISGNWFLWKNPYSFIAYGRQRDYLCFVALHIALALLLFTPVSEQFGGVVLQILGPGGFLLAKWDMQLRSGRCGADSH